MHIYINSCKEPFCSVEGPLVSGNNPIPDVQITASSEYNDWHGPRRARINNTLDGATCWLSDIAEQQAEPLMFIQVDSVHSILTI